MQNIGSLGEDYLLKKEISKDGQFSMVYLVEHKKTHQLYASKVNGDECYKEYISRERDIFQYLPTHPNIVRFREYGEEKLIENEEDPIDKSFIILEYCSKNTLTHYIFKIGNGFDEKFAKYIFKKILLAVQIIHNSTIVHLDLKTDNILLDENYNLKICDFGVSQREQGKIKLKKLRILTGTKGYKSPQIEDYKEFKVAKYGYNGYKNDIYSLGIILFTLVTGKLPFLNYSEYKKVIENLNQFLKKIEESINKSFSKEFKDLFTQMIAKLEKDRPTIEQILQFPWFDEINNLNNEKLLELENDLIKEYQKREKTMEECDTQNVKVKEEETHNSGGSRGVSEKCSITLFNKDDTILKFKKEENFENYINIKGKIIPYDFMNHLAELIKQNTNFLLNKKSELLEFKLIKKEEDNMEEEEEDEENEEKEEEETDKLKFIIPKKLSIKISLYKRTEEEYLLNFEKMSGDWMEYFDNFKIISSLVKKIPNIE